MRTQNPRVRKACLRAVKTIQGFSIKKLKCEKFLMYFEYAGLQMHMGVGAAYLGVILSSYSPLTD